MTWPPAAVQRAWGLTVEADLGGRLNLHWQVRAAGARAVLRRWHGPEAEVRYELKVLRQVAGLGWAVPLALHAPMYGAGAWWSLHVWVPGDPAPRENPEARGRWLAEVHAALAALPARPGWRPDLEVLTDPATDALLSAHEAARPDEVRLYRWHLERARAALAGLDTADRPVHLIHGDFTPWNLRVQRGRLTGLLDFELARPADPVADFALAWRGVHDGVVAGYAEVRPLSGEDRALLTPLWWGHLLTGACAALRAGVPDDGWTARKLQVRSPLMGSLAAPYPG
ncbi:aminoglycoside phosphotransferase family protein [Deinococcus sp. HMF7604]|uniref:phosphotransferase enzyme family protein n=1 Tax=Deinococcus betulae TaxID=2873312 RepID=UPI001CC901BC|nr:aminoglycoside phosphotransferase family protein [Deinococcus betulae]